MCGSLRTPWLRFLALAAMLTPALSPLCAQGRKPLPKLQKIPVRVSVRATWAESRDCKAREIPPCQSCRDEGSLTAEFDVDVESDNGVIWRNAQEGRTHVKYLDRTYCPVDGESHRTEGTGNAPILPWSVFSTRGVTIQEASLPMMMDKPPGAVSYGRHLLTKHPGDADRSEGLADHQRMLASRSDPSAGVDRELALGAGFHTTGYKTGDDMVSVHLLVNVTKEQPSGSVSWEARGYHSAWGLIAVRLKGLTGGRDEGHEERTEAETNRLMRYTVNWSFAPVAEDEMVFEVAPDYDRWTPAPRPEDLSGIAVSPSEEAWKPLEVKVKIRSKSGGLTYKAGKIRFTLEEVSKNSGYCINFPQGGKAKADLRFAKEQPPGIEVKGARATGAGAIVDVAETKQAVSEATVKLESLDPGAYGKLKATCEDLKLEALYEPTNTYALNIPKDEDGNHMADAWEQKQGIKGRDAAWDKVSVSGQPTVGDGLALYEKYRGAVVLVGDAKTWQRLPPDEKAFFVVDEGNHFLSTAWKKASETTGYRVSRDCTEAGTSSEASAVVNFNFSTVRNGRKYAVVATEKATGDEAQIATNGLIDAVLGETSVGNKPADITSCEVYPDRIRGGLRFTISRVGFAIEHYDEKLGAMSKAFTKGELERAFARLKDPAVFQSLYLQALRWAVLHEVGHACGMPGHLGGGGETTQGEVSCFMRYIPKDEGRLDLVNQALLPVQAQLPVGVFSFCKEEFNCFGHLNLKDN